MQTHLMQTRLARMGALSLAAVVILTGCAQDGDQDQAPGEGETTAAESASPTPDLPADRPEDKWQAAHMDMSSPRVASLVPDRTQPDPMFDGKSRWTSKDSGGEVWTYYADPTAPELAAVAVVFPAADECATVSDTPEGVMRDLDFPAAYADLVHTNTYMTGVENQAEDFDAEPVKRGGPDLADAPVYGMKLTAMTDPTGEGKAATGYAAIIQEGEDRYATNSCALVIVDRRAEDRDSFDSRQWAVAIEQATKAAESVTMEEGEPTPSASAS